MSAKVKAYKDGLRAEKLAAMYLRLKGYRILEERYKTPVGEIDLIACKRETLVVVEVKARKSSDEALHAINMRAQKRIQKAIGHFVIYNPEYAQHNIRFDVMAYGRGIVGGIWPKHLDNAWQAHIT